jgi:2-dehydropantoate 2-reductase
MRITIIGAGAMGCLYGARLSGLGHHVSLLDIRPDVVDAINRDGLLLDGASGPLKVAATAAVPDDAVGPADLISVHAHTDGTVDAARVASRVLAADGCAITFQNGIGNVEALVEAVGRHRVLGGISYNSARSAGPGCATHTNAGITWIGELDGSESARVADLCRLLEEAGFATRVSDNIMGIIWDKFIHNCAINPICAVTGLLANEVSAVPEADALQDRLLEELLAIVRARGIRLVDEDPIESIKEICRTVAVKPSMLQHIEAGQATEIDAQNGAAVRAGRALGIPTPYNEAVTMMVKAKSAQAMRHKVG